MGLLQKKREKARGKNLNCELVIDFTAYCVVGLRSLKIQILFVLVFFYQYKGFLFVCPFSLCPSKVFWGCSAAIKELSSTIILLVNKILNLIIFWVHAYMCLKFGSKLRVPCLPKPKRALTRSRFNCNTRASEVFLFS